VPVSAFSLRSKYPRFIQLLRVEGIGPTKKFVWSDTVLISVKLPNSGGIVPVNLLEARLRKSSNVRLLLSWQLKLSFSILLKLAIVSALLLKQGKAKIQHILVYCNPPCLQQQAGSTIVVLPTRTRRVA
jgi:hypothetical protein